MNDRAGALALLVAAPMIALGCGTGRAPDRVSVASEPVVEEPARPLTLDEQYLIGPTPGRELGYRIEFQTQTFPDDDSGIRMMSVQDDSVFVLDGHNFLTRLRRDNGTPLWRIPVGSRVDRINGITYVPALEQVLLTSGGNLFVLDDSTGSIIDKQRLGQIASTAPTVLGPFLVYGTRNGQVVWHSYEVGHTWRGYEIAPSVQIAPRIVGNQIVAIGSNGRVIVLHAPSAAAMWDKRLLNRVTAEPATGHGLVYIAGLDQYLWAIDIATGRTNWKYLADMPLECGPVLIENSVFQHIPNEGLVCFEARPVDAPGGQVTWSAPDVRGNVIGQKGQRLLVWDADRRQLTVMDAARGAVISTLDMPRVEHLQVSRPVDGDLFATGDDGRVIRLVPRT